MFIVQFDPRASVADMGIVPGFLVDDDPRPAKEQFDDRYAFGGGWSNIPKFKLNEDLSLKYPGDPVMKPLIGFQFRNEMIIMYPHAIFLILQEDGSFEVSRMD